RGGTNPQQIGLGVNVSSIQRMMSQGGAMRTDDPFHMMIDGDGFFVVGDNAGGLLFTRAGDFRRDRDYNIVMPNGLRLHGWAANTTPGGQLIIDGLTGQTTIERQQVSGIQIRPEMRTVPGRATGSIVFEGNLVPAENNVSSQVTFHDSQGNAYTVDVTFSHAMVPNAAGLVPPNARIQGAWDVTFDTTLRREDGTEFIVTPPIDTQRMFFGTNGNLMHIQPSATAITSTPQTPVVPPNTGPEFVVPVITSFAGYPNLVTSFAFGLDGASVAGGGQGVTFGQPNPPGPPPGPLQLVLNFAALTQMADATSSPIGHDMDGLAMGTLIGLSVGPDGIITGTYSNGQAFALWQIAVARFANPAGLESVGNNMFAQTINSGRFDNIGFPPGAISSSILGGTLEMSNVDLAAEFTEMITTQRGFQANSRVITTSDEILQELVNLRR
ncbi:MAG: flagellar hook-basal body complex protein, partial [Clostridiales bacterium]|nr:flagellar hook-basal body complex protein [Clostridiales bacterium]